MFALQFVRTSAERLCARRLFCSCKATPQLLPPSDSQRLLLCLDLEETLVFCETDDKSITAFRENNGPELMRAHAAARMHDKAFTVPAADAELELPYLDSPVRIHKRPNLEDFLDEASKLCDLVIFTSAAESYARAVWQSIDPARRCMTLLTRDACELENGVHLKDLSRLGRPLEQVVLLDDNAGSFLRQLDNGMPISAFFGDPADRGLASMIPLLHSLAVAADVRPVLRARFRIQQNMLDDFKELREALKA